MDMIFHMNKADRPEASAALVKVLAFARETRQLSVCTGESWMDITEWPDGPWHPAKLEGLQEGWMAEELIGANASAVRGWVGLKGMPLIQSNATKRPLLYTTDAAHTINGRQTVYFDGTDDCLSQLAADPFAKPTQCVIALTRPNPVAATEGVLWHSGDDGGANIWCWAGCDTSGNHVYHQRNADTEDVLTAGAMGTSPTVVEWTSDGAQNSLRLKHAVQTLTVTAGANNGHGFKETVGRDNFTLGCRKLGGNESRNFRGDVAFVLVLSHITPAERGMLFAWIASNYAVGL